DWFRLTLLDSILSGPGGPGGGSISNKSSRLYRALVKTELAAGAYGGLSPTVDPFLYAFTLTVRDGRTPAEVEAAFDSEIRRLCDDGVSEAEFERAKKQARATFAYSAERVTGQTSWLARAENFDSYAWFEQYMEHIEAVKLDEVNEAAKRYLVPQRRIVGWLIPEGDQA
ncbi:MAG: insulinase family protein, partial [Anaerolineae bacterium]|nr:insulinase family protein [Anaerolineae bacterium]